MKHELDIIQNRVLVSFPTYTHLFASQVSYWQLFSKTTRKTFIQMSSHLSCSKGSLWDNYRLKLIKIKINFSPLFPPFHQPKKPRCYDCQPGKTNQTDLNCHHHNVNAVIIEMYSWNTTIHGKKNLSVITRINLRTTLSLSHLHYYFGAPMSIMYFIITMKSLAEPSY